MIKRPIENSSRAELMRLLGQLEDYLQADVISYYGEIVNDSASDFKYIIEQLHEGSQVSNKKLYCILTTPGGSVLPVERMVTVMRRYYEYVGFIVPDYAYSAGTILCMSGDDILMNYYSALGPIDPQIQNKEGKLVAALGYLDKFEELIEKSKANKLSPAEFLLLKDTDLGEIRSYEQARNLTIDLLEKWLATYKFKNWETHRDGRPVTESERKKRAKEIGSVLSDSKKWKSHSRPITIAELTAENLRLKINDYSDDKMLAPLIDRYYEYLIEYIVTHNFGRFIHSRRFL